jgi:pyrimidine-nucleoside phosphorylase
MIGQTKDIAPADKRIYALRDVTATVECIPLIVASILSKKLAEGIDGLVLDVKVGRGAFMKDLAAARALATALVRVGTGAGKQVTAVLTRMDSPLGFAVGNANETREALEVLHGKGPEEIRECTFLLAREMLRLGKVADNDAEAQRKIDGAIQSGRALELMAKMVRAQHGDERVVMHPEQLAIHEREVQVPAPRSGVVTNIDALEIGLSAVALGAGRRRAEDAVDHAVGIRLLKKTGDTVREGEPLALLELRHATQAAGVAERVAAAYSLGDHAAPPGSLFIDRIGA